nr:purine nucleoside phosphorylase-like [Onthophagus taurus]
MSGDDGITVHAVEEAAKYVSGKIKDVVKIAIMCSSDLDIVSEILTIRRCCCIPYHEIPNFPKVVSKKSHQLIFGYFHKLPILIVQGKLHLYQGYTSRQCTMMIHILKALGVDYLFLGNTGVAINTKYQPGDIILINKHVYLMGFPDLYPVDEPLNEKSGPKFANHCPIYDKKLLLKSKDILTKDLEFQDKLHVGTYAYLTGPNYATVAEVKFLNARNVDVIGMCIVPEVLAAKRCGMKVLAFSLITSVFVNNYDNDSESCHDDIIQISNERSLLMKVFLEKLISFLCDSEENHLLSKY